MLHPALGRALATAHIEDLLRDTAQRHTIRLARRVAHEPHLAGASDVPMFGGRNMDRPSRLACSP
jgi:hypothetical protein